MVQSLLFASVRSNMKKIKMNWPLLDLRGFAAGTNSYFFPNQASPLTSVLEHAFLFTLNPAAAAAAGPLLLSDLRGDLGPAKVELSQFRESESLESPLLEKFAGVGVGVTPIPRSQIINITQPILKSRNL